MSQVDQMWAQKRSSTFQCRVAPTETEGALSDGNVKTRHWNVELRRASDFLRPRLISYAPEELVKVDGQRATSAANSSPSAASAGLPRLDSRSLPRLR
jgi:hypothetical protein